MVAQPSFLPHPPGLLYALERNLAMTAGKTSRLAIHKTSFQALAAGVKIAFGTDAGSFPHGTQAIEFKSMTRYGMSPLEAIRSRRQTPLACSAGVTTSVPCEPGKYADLIVVDGDPLNDIEPA